MQKSIQKPILKKYSKMNRAGVQKYYGMLSFFPCKAGEKAATEMFWNYRKYGTDDIGANDNLAMLAGTQVYKNTFSLVLDFDFDIGNDPGVLKKAMQVCSDTVVVKSGGKHNGFHVHYLTPIPVKSYIMPKRNGTMEMKAINQDGRPEPMMLPPSKVNRKYEVIHPYRGDWIDFRRVKVITSAELKQKLQKLNEIL